MGIFDNIGRDLKNAFNPSTIKRVFQPVTNTLGNKKNWIEFEDGFGTGLGGVENVVSKISNVGSTILSNPILDATVTLLAPELSPVLMGGIAATKLGGQLGNGLEKAGTAINKKDNSVNFL